MNCASLVLGVRCTCGSNFPKDDFEAVLSLPPYCAIGLSACEGHAQNKNIVQHARGINLIAHLHTNLPHRIRHLHEMSKPWIWRGVLHLIVCSMQIARCWPYQISNRHCRLILVCMSSQCWSHLVSCFTHCNTHALSLLPCWVCTAFQHSCVLLCRQHTPTFVMQFAERLSCLCQCYFGGMSSKMLLHLVW